jgi:malate dehydrogenase
MKPRILIIGAGMVGSSCAASMAARHLGTIYLYDVIENLSMGRAMDINHTLPVHGSDAPVIGCTRLDDAGDSDIAVITAGAPRQPGMSRLDLLKNNAQTIKMIAMRIASLCPSARVLMVTNPVDVLTWYFRSLCPDMHVFGLGCSLDNVRFKYFIAQTAHVSVKNVQGLVIGTHDDNMIPLTDYACIGGIPAGTFIGNDEMNKIVDMTRTAGGTIINLMKSHSGYYAAGEVIASIVESIILDKGMVFPLSILPDGEYGYRNICLALPCIVDSSGIREIITLNLREQEKIRLDICAGSMITQIGYLKGPSPFHEPLEVLQ